MKQTNTKEAVLSSTFAQLWKWNNKYVAFLTQHCLQNIYLESVSVFVMSLQNLYLPLVEDWQNKRLLLKASVQEILTGMMDNYVSDLNASKIGAD